MSSVWTSSSALYRSIILSFPYGRLFFLHWAISCQQLPNLDTKSWFLGPLEYSHPRVIESIYKTISTNPPFIKTKFSTSRWGLILNSGHYRTMLWPYQSEILLTKEHENSVCHFSLAKALSSRYLIISSPRRPCHDIWFLKEGNSKKLQSLIMLLRPTKAEALLSVPIFFSWFSVISFRSPIIN